MKARGWVVLQRRFTANGLLLIACLLGTVARVEAQPEVIATAAPVAPSTQVVPAPMPSEIQPVSYAATSPPVSPPPNPRPMLSLPPTVSADEPDVKDPMKTTTPSPAVATPLGTTLSVEVLGPDRLQEGQPLTEEIVLHNVGVRPLAEIHLEQPLPDGVRVVRTDPPAVMRDKRLTWDLRHLEAGGERRLKIELNPGTLRELDLRPYVTFLPSNGLLTRIVRPPFSVEMTADVTKAARGERIRFTIRATNNGETPIGHIKLYDTLPAGLFHPRGPKIGIPNFGDLQPGESRSVTLETTSVDCGSFRNEVLVQADFGVEARAGVEVVVAEPDLTLHVDGPKQCDTQHEVDFRIEVANLGTTTAHNVRLVQALPPTFDFGSASTGASLDKSQHALVWSLSDLNAGERQSVTFRCKASLAGDWPMTTAVFSRDRAETRVASTLHAEAALATAALKLEVQAREEHVGVGTETVYRLHVFNNGDATCTGLRLSASLPEAVTPFKTEGPSDGRIENLQVTFAPLAQLDGHSDVVYRLHVRGRQAGKGTLKVELTADQQTLAAKEICIQVEEAARTATNAERDNSPSSEKLR
jgi:uncharacterized repeat protein (TIGR01451 family)